MDKLHRLLSDSALDFGALFEAATRDLSRKPPLTACTFRLEGWVVPARGGFVLGEGELFFKGKAHRFHFSTRLAQYRAGIVGLSGTGNVADLEQLADFTGTYHPFFTVLNTDTTLGLRLINDRGVLLELKTPDSETPFEPANEGLSLRLL